MRPARPPALTPRPATLRERTGGRPPLRRDPERDQRAVRDDSHGPGAADGDRPPTHRAGRSRALRPPDADERGDGTNRKSDPDDSSDSHHAAYTAPTGR